MIKIGEYQTLTIVREKPQGFYLMDEEGNEVLFPRGFIKEGMELDDAIEVFVYIDSNEMEVATLEKPYVTVGQYAFLRCAQVNQTGAFFDWGVVKQLLVPFRNQYEKVEEGKSYIIYLYVDEVTERLVGTTKIDRYLELEADEHLKKGQEVDLLIVSESELGFTAIVNQQYLGLLYHNEVAQPINIGDQLKGYIKPIREDKKIDLTLNAIGHQNIEPNAKKILEKLTENDGFLPYHDKSDPDEIRKVFGISKKLFKKSIGNLYKSKLILIKEDGIQSIA